MFSFEDLGGCRLEEMYAIKSRQPEATPITISQKTVSVSAPVHLRPVSGQCPI